MKMNIAFNEPLNKTVCEKVRYRSSKVCDIVDCIVCELSTLLQSDGTCGHCEAEILNCMVCFNESVCSHCLTGYYATGLSGNESCSTCEAGC